MNEELNNPICWAGAELFRAANRHKPIKNLVQIGGPRPGRAGPGRVDPREGGLQGGWTPGGRAPGECAGSESVRGG